MLSWFLRGLRRGVVTTRYPKGPVDEWSATLPTPPEFMPEHLTVGLADDLVRACPVAALRRDGDVLVFDAGGCVACGRCLAIAPQAVRASGRFELAATKRQQLIKHIRLGGAHHDHG